MALELINKQTLWDPGATDLTTAFVNGENKLFLPGGTLSVTTTTIAPTQWHQISIHGGDYLLIKGKSKVTSVTGGTVITDSQVRCGALGVYEDDGYPFDGPLFAQGTPTMTTLGSAAATGLGALYLQRTAAGAAGVITDAADFNSGTITTNGFLAIPDNSNMAADDLTEFGVWIGELAVNTQPASTQQTFNPRPRVSGMSKVYLGLWNNSLLTAATSALVVDATIDAYVYRELTHTKPIDRRMTYRRDRR